MQLASQAHAQDALGAYREGRRLGRQIRWPSKRFRVDPVLYFRRILGVEPWTRQIEIIEAVRDYPRVAVASGHKVSKSHTAGGLALWFYGSFDDAQVVMSSTTSRQVDQILWRQLRMLKARAGRCVECKAKDPDEREIPTPCPHSALIDGQMGQLARTGLKSRDFRVIYGFTAKEGEAVAGISGSNVLFIVDEASGVPQDIFDAIEGNRAGGARIVLFGNPTRNEGEHFDAFHAKADFYHSIRVSSEETPNVVRGRVVVPGLATREWVEEKKREWGEDSALYKIRVRGEHALAEEGRIFSVHAITEAEDRWDETPAEGRLYVGIDAAGESGTGDEAVFAPRRGRKLLELEAHRGLSAEAHLVHLLAMLDRHRLPRETPVVVLDGEGAVGAKVLGVFRAYLEEHKAAPPFELAVIRASDGAVRQPRVYDRMRDELTANLEGWFRDEGAIVEDAKLAQELHVWEWEEQARTGKLKLIPAKRQLRRKPPHGIGRSPDRYDALALSCWEPLALRDPGRVARKREADEDDRPLDPYSAARTWRRGR